MDTDKNWNRPWNTDEIIANAENWSLAGDVALLNTIKQFANNLLTKTDNLNKNVNDLLKDLNEVGLQLDLSQNEFQSLKNTQFIESRVYDDDETLDSNGNEKVLEQNAKQPEEETHFDVNLTLEVELLDKYFETVEISISDSEDESEKSFVLKPIDVYTDRPLPPLIGSKEWYTNWYLEDEFNDTDSQKSEEVYSDSDSDNNLPKDLTFTSETSSEIDFSHSTNENKHVTNANIKNIVKIPESTASTEGSESSSSLQTKVPISNKIFAEQLTAKLDNVISKEEKISEEINSKPIQPIKNNTFLGLFADEPPPLSDSENKTTKGIFSGGKNLFDEDDDEDTLFKDSGKKGVLTHNTPKSVDDVFENTSINNNFFPQSSQVSKGLFDSDDSDDEVISSNRNKQNTFLQYQKSVVPLIEDEPPALDRVTSTKKKPVGGVSVFGKENINDSIKKRQNNSSENQENKTLGKDEVASQKILNLFQDNDEDIFTKINSKKTNLFDDDLNKENRNKSSSETLEKKKKILSLFDDDDESEKEDDLFNIPKKNKEKKSDLFDDALFSTDPPMIKDNNKTSNIKNSLDKDEKIDIGINTNFDKSSEEIDKKSVQFIDNSSFSKDKQLSVKSKLASLFDDNEEDDEDDIFANVTKKIDFNLFEEPESSDDLFSIKKEIKTDQDIIKIAQVENTKDFVKNKFDKSKSGTNEDTNKFAYNIDTIKQEDYSKSQRIEKDDSKSGSVLEENNMSLFDDDMDEVGLFGTNEKFHSFNDAKREDTSNKPPIAQKPHSNIIKESGIVQSSISTKICESEYVSDPFLKTSTSPTSNDIISGSTSEKLFVQDSVPVVALFESTPPPDDYEWDNKSDILSDTEDFLGYGRDKNDIIISSVFDNEPPSLNEDESSGIVKNPINIRIDTDDSLFDPQASSLSRLSSEILEDSILITNQSQFSIIAEDSKITIDVVPSETLDVSSEDVQNIKNEKIIENEELLENKEVGNKKIASITEMLRNQNNQNQKKNNENKSSPGKLKQSLNINVEALLPGYSQQKIGSLSKSQSCYDSGNEISNVINLSENEDENNKLEQETSIGFDTTDRVEILPNITKGRVRIPTKRRPPSRRGRQEVICKSTSGELSPDSDELEAVIQQVSNSTETNKQIVSMKTNNNENIKSKSDSHSIDSPLEEIKNETIKRITKKDLFGSGSESDDDLFGTQKNKKGIGKKANMNKSLFDDSSSEDDLFLDRKTDKSTVKTQKVEPTIKKLENVETEEDPLSNLL
ncbi:WASH complex subunit 2 [Diorhabda sublineata]|uniref:WASH complex subunit 2 n=1 Tax=Diorhabda sublineata TaxID=1163346 RepID=UPI0024E15E11|nr:WASH complex subunit 2 [Diorhabda sublineata]